MAVSEVGLRLKAVKVAIVHDWLTGMRGGERVLEQFLRLYPEADLFTLVHVPGSTSALIDSRVKGSSWLNRLPAVGRYYRLLLPLYPLAVRSISLKGYHLVISLSHAAAKNVRVDSGATHLCYCFTPMRYIWDRARDYLGPLTPLAYPVIKLLRSWDLRGSGGVTHFVGISRFVAARIRKYYGVRASVVYPAVSPPWEVPAGQDLFQRDLFQRDLGEHSDGIGGGERRCSEERPFLYAGALVPYKRVDLVIEACVKNGWPLVIAGAGPDLERLKRLSAGRVSFLGRVSDAELGPLFAGARALLFPGTEDFGLIPLEALCAGCPVIGSFSGALRETLNGVRPWEFQPGAVFKETDKQDLADQPGSESLNRNSPAGVFMRPLGSQAGYQERLSALEEAVRFFVEHEAMFSKEGCQRQGELFSVARFIAGWQEVHRRFVGWSKSGVRVEGYGS